MIKLRDVMTTEVVTLSPDLTIRAAADTLTGRHISGAPVVSGGRAVGMLTSTDLLEFMAGLDRDPAEAGGASERTLMDEHTVEEAMSRGPLHTLPPSASLRQAAEMMRARVIHRVFVTEQDAIVGVVSALDVTTALAKGMAEVRTFIFPRSTRTP